MVDDLIELVLDLAVDLGTKLGSEKKETKEKKKVPSAGAGKVSWIKGKGSGRRGQDPWDLPREKPPWEK